MEGIIRTSEMLSASVGRVVTRRMLRHQQYLIRRNALRLLPPYLLQNLLKSPLHFASLN